MKTRRKKSPLRISPVFGPKLGEDQKKRLHSDLVRFGAKTLLKLQRGGHAAILHTILC